MEVKEVMDKAFGVLSRELSVEEYLVYLRTVTPRIGDATRELRDKTGKMKMEEVIQMAKEIEGDLATEK
jgi:hypothetical protein